MQHSNRDLTFDVLKGSGILLMVTAHTLGWKHFLYPYIYAFHIPLFFLVSGYLYKPRTIREQIKKDFKRLLIPYITITIIEIFLVFIYKAHFHHNIYIAFYLFSNSISPVWFLLALFISKAIFNLVLANTKHFIIFSLIISSISCWVTSNYCFQLPFCISSATGALIFIAIGYHAKKNNLIDVLRNYSWCSIPLAVLLWINTSVFGKVDTYQNLYQLWLIDVMGAIGGTYLFYRISQQIVLHCKVTLGILSKAGYYSIIILSFHSVEFIFPQWFQILFFLNNSFIIPAILIVRFIFAYLSIQITLRVRLMRLIFSI